MEIHWGLAVSAGVSACLSPSPAGLGIVFGGLSTWHRKQNTFYQNECLAFAFLFFLERNNSEGRTVPGASGLRPATAFGSSMLQPCLLKAAVLQPWHKMSALSQVLCLKGSRIIPFQVVPVSAVMWEVHGPIVSCRASHDIWNQLFCIFSNCGFFSGLGESAAAFGRFI